MQLFHWLSPLLAEAADGDTPSTAVTPPASAFHFPENFWPSFLGALCFALLAIVLSLLAFKLFDWMTPKIDVQLELGQKHNIAVAIVCAAIILGSCYLVATVVRGPM